MTATLICPPGKDGFRKARLSFVLGVHESAIECEKMGSEPVLSIFRALLPSIWSHSYFCITAFRVPFLNAEWLLKALTNKDTCRHTGTDLDYP